MSLKNSLRHKWQSFETYLWQPVDVATLATFRFVFGALMVWEVYRYFEYDRIYRYYIEPNVYFPYEFFPFVKPWPGDLMYLHFYVMGLCAAGVMLGFFYRISIIGFFLTYTYVFLIDKTQHNNHYYLIILLSFLMMFTDAHRWLSVDKLFLDRLKSEVIPFWQQFILRTQMVIVYFYAGVAKINVDWLQGEPVGSWIRSRGYYPIDTALYHFGEDSIAFDIAVKVSEFFVSPWAPYFFAYGGLLFDLSIGFLLWWKHTRLLALFPLFFFHLMNKYLFNIGIFPYLAIGSTILFADPDWPRQLLRLPRPTLPESWPRRPLHHLMTGGVVLYLTVQILVPLRHWLYPGDVAWNEEGHRYSWRMKLRDKDAYVIFRVTDPATDTTWEVDLESELTPRQIRKMSHRPDMIYYYAQHLKQVTQAAGIENPIIQVEGWASLNGRPYQPFIDPEVNLAAIDDYYSNIFAHGDWILPVKKDVPIERYPEAQTELQDDE